VDVTGAHQGKADSPGAIALSAVRIAAFLVALAIVPALFVYGLVAGSELVQWGLIWVLQMTVIVAGFRSWRRDQSYLLWNQVLLVVSTTLRVVAILAGWPQGLVSVVGIITGVTLVGMVILDVYAIRAGKLDWPWWPAPRKPAAPE
jgi:hypothetical protein